MQTPLTLTTQGNTISPWACIAANILHMYEFQNSPDAYAIDRALDKERDSWSSLVVYLLQCGLSIQSIRRYHPEYFLAQGKLHLRDVTATGPWTAEHEESFNNTWTEEKIAYEQSRTREWLSACEAASGQIQFLSQEPDFNSIRSSLYYGGQVCIMWGHAPETSVPVVVYGQEETLLKLYCPMWNDDCLQTRTRRDVESHWRSSAGVDAIWNGPLA